MIQLSANGITVSFGGETLFSDVEFRVDEQMKVGLVGVNGCGKTTLFRVINGLVEAESGNISRVAGLKIGYMEQYVIRDDKLTLYDEVKEVFRELIDIEDELFEINLSIDGGDHSEKTLARQMQLSDIYNREGGNYYKSLVTSALLGLGFTEDELTRPISVLSGGQKSKAQLAKLLLSKSNFLLLDEPTNHLDIKACEWLERFLTDYKGAYIVISHDRYFLDKVTDTTFELENGRLTTYKGSYTRYLELKAQARETQQRVYERTMKEINRIEGIIDQQRRWGVEHNYITAASKQKSADRLRETLEKPTDLPDGIKFRFTCGEEGGNDALLAENISKSFDGKLIFSGASLDIKKGETVFILGENGCGKTTLLKILTGKLEADSGKIVFGAKTSYGYYDQAQTELSYDKTVMDEVWDSFPKMTQTQVRTALASFLFKGEDVFKIVGECSGGEKARIALLKLMLCGKNLLLLDEPTNHLDIHSREALEDALSGYGGTLVIVSHDRYLINKLATRIVVLEKDNVKKIEGNYDTYTAMLDAQPQPEKQEKKAEKKTNLYKERKEREAVVRKLRSEISSCEKRIDELSAKYDERSALMATDEYALNYEKAAELAEELRVLKEEEDELTARWLELSEQMEDMTAES